MEHEFKLVKKTTVSGDVSYRIEIDSFSVIIIGTEQEAVKAFDKYRKNFKEMGGTDVEKVILSEKWINNEK